MLQVPRDQLIEFAQSRLAENDVKAAHYALLQIFCEGIVSDPTGERRSIAANQAAQFLARRVYFLRGEWPKNRSLDCLPA